LYTNIVTAAARIVGYRRRVEPRPSAVITDEPSNSVTLVVPVRDEADYIDRCLAALTAQEYPAHLLEIVVVDGDSTDDTGATAQKWADRDPRVTVLRNPDRLMIPGLNLGIRHGSGSFVGSIIGHSFPPADYVRRCVELLAEHDAWGVGGTYERVATTSLQRAIGRAQSHPFGVGDAFHNYGGRAGWAETVFPGFWPRWVFERVGYFDERMLYNEDNEFSHRIRKAGGRVWYEPSLRIGYAPRRSFGTLFRQYHRYGRGKADVFRKHPGAFRARHLAPLALVGGLVGGGVVGVFVPAIRIATAAGVGLYLVAAAIAGVSAARGRASPALVAIAFMVMHVAYGVGLLTGLGRLVMNRRPLPTG
jgi:succinoglycan biosynthesis protein ExoA